MAHSIVKKAKQLACDRVFEIGPGLGSLTDPLNLTFPQLTVLELDKSLAQYWRKRGLEVLEQDALKTQWSLFITPPRTHLLVSNLPYQIASRLFINLSFLNPSFDSMILMFQKEVGQRLQAQKSTKNYGLLSVVAQAFWKIEFLLEAGSVDFYPRPQVASHVLVFNRKTTPTCLKKNSFLNFLKSTWTHRRKTLLPRLKSLYPQTPWNLVFKKKRLSPLLRAENLKVQEFVDLYLINEEHYRL